MTRAFNIVLNPNDSVRFALFIITLMMKMLRITVMTINIGLSRYIGSHKCNTYQHMITTSSQTSNPHNATELGICRSDTCEW